MLDPGNQPEPGALTELLGSAAAHWHSLIAMTRERAARPLQAWHFAGTRIGWSLRLLDDARILVYLTPGKNQVQVGLVLGAKSVAAAREAGLSVAAARLIDAAPKYAEGYGVRFVVATADDLSPFPELLAIKCALPAKASRRERVVSTGPKREA